MDHRNESEREQLLATLRTRYVEVDRSGETGLAPDDVALRFKDSEMTRRHLTASCRAEREGDLASATSRTFADSSSTS
jgi:hypothetical protein